MKTILLVNLSILFLALPTTGWAQFISVSGYVTTNTNGNALENANVFESNSNTGTITNAKGFFKLTLKQGKNKVRFTKEDFKDYITSLNLKSDTILTVKLNPILPENNQYKKSKLWVVSKKQKEQSEE